MAVELPFPFVVESDEQILPGWRPPFGISGVNACQGAVKCYGRMFAGVIRLRRMKIISLILTVVLAVLLLWRLPL